MMTITKRKYKFHEIMDGISEICGGGGEWTLTRLFQEINSITQ